MAKTVIIAALAVLTGISVVQYVRVMQPDKEVWYHHYEHCYELDLPLPVKDITEFKHIVIAAGVDQSKLFSLGADNVDSGKLLALWNLNSTSPSYTEVKIRNYPNDTYFQPFGMYFVRNSDALYVLNHAFNRGGSRVDIFNLTADDQDVEASYHGSMILPTELHGRHGDLIVESDFEVYLSEFSSYPLDQTGGPQSSYGYYRSLLDNFLQIKNTCVWQCTFALNSVGNCRALNNTSAVSVTGITKDKFGEYMVSYSSFDYNWVAYYERNWRKGDFELQRSVALRDRIERIEWDHGSQRVYGASMPWFFSFDDRLPGGAIEIKNWESVSGLVYRRLYLQENLQKGTTCAVRKFDRTIAGSALEKGVLVCPMTGPNN